MDCCKSKQCQGIEEIFDASIAEKDLKNYLEKGPSKETALLLDIIRERLPEGFSVMDIGGGVGAIQHDLAHAGAGAIINVDASPAYSKVAQEEAGRRGYAEIASYHVGDFVNLGPELPDADIVTLDRVICCYDNMPALVHEAVRKTRRVLGVVYPRDTWYIKLGIGLANLVMAILGRRFRIYAHATQEVDRLVNAAGFDRDFYRRGFFWQVAVYGK